MMTLSSLALSLGIVFGITYAVMGVAALGHVIREPERTLSYGNKLASYWYWWPFYDIYDNFGNRLRIYGKITFTLCAATYILWGIQKT